MTTVELNEIGKLVEQVRYKLYVAVVLGDEDSYHLRSMEWRIWELQQDLSRLYRSKQPKRLIWSEF